MQTCTDKALTAQQATTSWALAVRRGCIGKILPLIKHSYGFFRAALFAMIEWADMWKPGAHTAMVNLTLRGTALYTRDPLPASMLRQLAVWASKLGSIVINGQSLTAEQLNQLALQSEQSGQPISFGEFPEPTRPRRHKH